MDVHPAVEPPTRPIAQKARRPNRSSRPWSPYDFFWAAVLSVASICWRAASPFVVGHIAATGTTTAFDCIASSCASVALYAAGVRLHSRFAGVAAGMLFAISATAVTGAGAGTNLDVLFVTTLSLALAFCSAELVIPAVLSAVILAALRADGLIIGAGICAACIAIRRDYTAPAVVGFAASLALVEITTHHVFAHFGFRWTSPLEVMPLVADLLAVGLALVGSAYELIGRAVPTIKAVVPWLLVLSFLSLSAHGTVLPVQQQSALPALYLAAGVGIGRMMPAIAGEFITPWQRYTSAVATVLVLIAAHVAGPLAVMYGR